jgi:hypothetical protein
MGDAEPRKAVVVVAARLAEIVGFESSIGDISCVGDQPTISGNFVPGLNGGITWRRVTVCSSNLQGILEQRHPPLIATCASGSEGEYQGSN